MQLLLALVAQMGGLWSYLYIIFLYFVYRVRHKIIKNYLITFLLYNIIISLQFRENAVFRVITEVTENVVKV